MGDLYTKKSVTIEAYQLSKLNAEALAIWCGGRMVEEIDAVTPTDTYVGVNIPTLEGVMRASEGDYIIKGIEGEFYPCKLSIFQASYDPPA